MDILSYLLGKHNGGGGGSSLDWSSLGYDTTPQGIINIYNYSKEIKDNWENDSSLYNKFANDKKLIVMPMVNTSNATTTQGMFINCSGLTDVPLLNTSNSENTRDMFNGCSSLKEIPSIDISKSTNARSMFSSCTELINIPLFNIPKVRDLYNLISNCKKLNDSSIDNILQMCISATSYNSTKTLAYLGFNSTDYPAIRIQALSHYQDFIDAGWTIGY